MPNTATVFITCTDGSQRLFMPGEVRVVTFGPPGVARMDDMGRLPHVEPNDRQIAVTMTNGVVWKGVVSPEEHVRLLSLLGLPPADSRPVEERSRSIDIPDPT